jgi:hypothetical protein
LSHIKRRPRLRGCLPIWCIDRVKAHPGGSRSLLPRHTREQRIGESNFQNLTLHKFLAPLLPSHNPPPLNAPKRLRERVNPVHHVLGTAHRTFAGAQPVHYSQTTAGIRVEVTACTQLETSGCVQVETTACIWIKDSSCTRLDSITDIQVKIIACTELQVAVCVQLEIVTCTQLKTAACEQPRNTARSNLQDRFGSEAIFHQQPPIFSGIVPRSFLVRDRDRPRKDRTRGTAP